MTKKKVIRNFYPENGNFFLKLGEKFFGPPKFGARSPPMLILLLTQNDVNLTLGHSFDACEKNCGRGWDSNLETMNSKHATQRDWPFVIYAMGCVKHQLCKIVVATSMTSLRGPLVRRPPDVPVSLRKRIGNANTMEEQSGARLFINT